MFEIGQKIYFKREGIDQRLLKGTIISIDDTGYQVRGARTAITFTPPVHTLQAHEINTTYVPEKLRPRKLESGHGSGLSIVVEESIRRKAIVIERLGMSEDQVLQARAMLEIRRRAVRGLAGISRIPCTREDFSFQELDSEYVVAQLAALRATASSATDADLREFKRYLDGEVGDSKMMLTICRTSRTAAIRFLRKRQEYHRFHVDIADYAYRLAA